MEIYAKIGTGSQSHIRVGWKRKPPKVGDVIKFKRLPVGPGDKWERGKIDMIRDLGYKLYYLVLW